MSANKVFSDAPSRLSPLNRKNLQEILVEIESSLIPKSPKKTVTMRESLYKPRNSMSLDLPSPKRSPRKAPKRKPNQQKTAPTRKIVNLELNIEPHKAYSPVNNLPVPIKKLSEPPMRQIPMMSTPPAPAQAPPETPKVETLDGWQEDNN